MRCPNCGKIYDTVLIRRYPEMPIQEEFINAKPWEREQCISGLCGDKCWKQFLGIGGL